MEKESAFESAQFAEWLLDQWPEFSELEFTETAVVHGCEQTRTLRLGYEGGAKRVGLQEVVADSDPPKQSYRYRVDVYPVGAVEKVTYRNVELPEVTLRDDGYLCVKLTQNGVPINREPCSCVGVTAE